MITKEEYKKTLIRMWDSVRDGYYEGNSDCHGVECETCPIGSMCGKVMNYYDVVEFVEKWGKEHPIKTNREVLAETLKEKFGDIFSMTDVMCRLEDTCMIFSARCPKGDCTCAECGQQKFWDREYKEVSHE